MIIYNLFMKTLTARIILIILILSLFLLVSCARPLTAEETEKEREYYEQKYENEPVPEKLVKEVLEYLDECVGGQYIYGAQGDAVTRDFVLKSNERHDNYFSHGRLEYFLAIAEKCEQEDEHSYPKDYAWDCSGLWWDCSNKLELYEEWTDMTAAQTYKLCCTPIQKNELRPGDLVFVENDEGKITHMGIVGTHGFIYEAVSGFVGVVKKRTIDKRVYNDVVRGGVLTFEDWNVFGRLMIFQ